MPWMGTKIKAAFSHITLHLLLFSLLLVLGSRCLFPFTSHLYFLHILVPCFPPFFFINLISYSLFPFSVSPSVFSILFPFVSHILISLLLYVRQLSILFHFLVFLLVCLPSFPSPFPPRSIIPTFHVTFFLNSSLFSTFPLLWFFFSFPTFTVFVF
jgi:hypothetical protein